jgi:hypothetical protein
VRGGNAKYRNTGRGKSEDGHLRKNCFIVSYIPKQWDPAACLMRQLWFAFPLSRLIFASTLIQPSLLQPRSATFTKTTSAKRISTNKFHQPATNIFEKATQNFNVNVDDCEDIKVVHFGLV